MIRKVVIATALVLATTVISNAATHQSAQRSYDPSVESVGFTKMTQQWVQRPYDPSAGSVGFKKSKKKKKKK
jgi:hypothetical protein